VKFWLAILIALIALPLTAQKPPTETCMPCHAAEVADFQTHPHFAKGLGCDTCHAKSITHRNSKGEALPDRWAAGKQALELCGGCHKAELKSYLTSEHAKLALAQSDVAAPVCITCHGVHKRNGASRIERTCLGCHEASFSGAAKVAEGKVSCTHCHSAHSSE
jgi:hypothetical protein